MNWVKRSRALAFLLYLQILYCKSYEIVPNLASAKKPEKIELLECVLRPGFDESSAFKAFQKAIEKRSYIQIVWFGKQIKNEYCEIEIAGFQVGGTDAYFGISVLTLGLIPIYEPMRRHDEITIRYFKAGKISSERKYFIAYSAWYWIPFIPMAFFNQQKIDEKAELILTDYFSES